MTYHDGHSPYLDEAAALLRKAAETNESNNRSYVPLLVEGRERIAMKFAQLAAIDKGLVPAEVVESLLAHIVRGEVR